MRKSEAKRLSKKFQLGKEVIRDVGKKTGLNAGGIEELLNKCEEFRKKLNGDGREKRIFSVERLADAFAKYKHFTIFDAFLLFLTQNRVRSIIKEVVEIAGGAPPPEKVMEVAFKEFEEKILHGAEASLAAM